MAAALLVAAGAAMVGPGAPSSSTSEGVSPNLSIKAKKGKAEAPARSQRNPGSSVAQTPAR
jgi:hypothetical protein